MRFSDDQTRDMVAIKENLLERIQKHQASIDMLEKNLAIFDLILKESSFTKASQLNPPKAADSVPIRQGSGGRVIANACITPKELSIVLDEGIDLSDETPPFKSFFLDRIIGQMQKKDQQRVQDGQIQQESVINYTINKNGQEIREIVIKNYGQKERLDELISTAGWSLTRMLENK